MPIYEYRCSGCDKVFEVIRKFSEKDKELSCRELGCEKDEDCDKKLTMSLSSFQLKGSGWYKDGYSKAGKK